MCNFASFVLTKNDVLYLDTSDSHEDIIRYHKLNDSELNIVRVELKPPTYKENIQNINQWKFIIDQDIFPDWTYPGDPTLEEKARKALARRIEEQKIGYVIEKGSGQKVVVGHYGKAITDEYGISISGDFGVSVSGYKGKSISGYAGESIGSFDSEAITGNYGKATARNFSKATAGLFGMAQVDSWGIAIAGENGIAIAGEESIAIVGEYGKAKAGYNSQIQLHYKVKRVPKVKILYTGDNDIKPDVFYQIVNGEVEMVGN